MSIAEKLQTIAENEQRVYEAGKTQGETIGRKSQYDEFWDGIMDKGNRTQLQYAFSYWYDTIFYPKYDLVAVNAVGIFSGCKVVNLKQRLIDCGVVLDTSAATNLSNTFAYSTYLTHIPTIDARSATMLGSIFYNNQKMVEVEKIILSDSGNTTFVDAFRQCYALESITIEGVIGNSINLQWSTKLSKASITSIINALSATKSGQTATFSKTAVETAFGSTTSTEWLALVATKSNWTISLA